MKKLLVALMCAFTLTAFAADSCTLARDSAGRIKRSAAAVVAFKKANPCPANGHTSGICPGYIVDHVKPLCACGEDKPSNMQWQTLADSKAKDRLEDKQCAALKASGAVK